MTTLTAYTTTRPDVQALVPGDARRILDLGCSNGALGAALKAADPDRHLTGIERAPAFAAVATGRLDTVHNADLTTFDWTRLDPQPFDCLICADILEHLSDPWTVLNTAVTHLRPGGAVIISVPNIRHISALYWIYGRGIWPRRDRGIFDRTHLRYFTLDTLRQLLHGAGCRPEMVRRNYRLIERPHPINAAIRPLTPLLDRLPLIRELWTFQYLVRGRKEA